LKGRCQQHTTTGLLQTLNQSLDAQGETSGGASPVKEPGHFEVRKFSVVALKTQAANAVSPSK